MNSLPKLLIALTVLAFCWSCTGAQSQTTASSSGGSVKMLSDADYKRIGVKETSDGK